MNFKNWIIENTNDYPAEAIELAKKIINGTVKRHSMCIDEPNIMYDAIFYPDQSKPAVFLNISNKLPGSKLGIVAFLDFLWIAEEYSKDKSFLSTQRTAAGENLYQKMANLGLMQKDNSQKSILGYDLWHITGNPQKKLFNR